MRTTLLCTLIFCLCIHRADVLIAAPQDRPRSAVPQFEKLPAGWEVVREVQVSSAQLAQFSKKLGVPLTGVFNTFLRNEGKELQINTLTLKSVEDAEQLAVVLRKGRANPRWVARSNNQVYEFVVQRTEQARLACKARSELAIMPAARTYSVTFSAVPIKGEDAAAGVDGRNRLFNLFLQQAGKSTESSEMAALAKSFQFASKLQLVGNLRGAVEVQWQSPEAKISPSPSDPELVDVEIVQAKQVAGMPVIDLQANIKIDRSRSRAANPEPNSAVLLMANPRFPVDDSAIQATVKAIGSNSGSDAQKLARLLDWFGDAKNMRYDGLVGSRYGTLTVLQQHYGRCWDYSDLFITMARASGLPCRQVYGWIYESEGHVWCDVLVDGKWTMVDPTSGAACDIDYIPFCISTSGELPLIYASRVVIDEK